ncbi:MAG: M48 family metalloprotease [Coleofasciculaceae cyanobacterium]
MKLLWNSLLISLGILLPTSTSVVLAESVEPSQSVSLTASTAEVSPISAPAVPVAKETLITVSGEAEAISLTSCSDCSTVTEVKEWRVGNEEGENNLTSLPLNLGSADTSLEFSSVLHLETFALPEVIQEYPSTFRQADVSGQDVETIVIPDIEPVYQPPVRTAEESSTTPAPESNEEIETPVEVETPAPELEEETETTVETETPTSESDAETETKVEVETTPDESETTSTESAEEEEEDKLTPEEIAQQQKLIEADRLYLSGEREAAEQLYRQAKEPFGTEVEGTEEKAEPFYEVVQLSPAGSVYWRQSTDGLEQELESKILVPLQFLVEQQPEFIPGHIRYAQALKNYEREEEALQVLEQAVTLYPNEPELLKVTIEALAEAEQWLEASLTARQFASLNPEHPQSEEFETLADENLESYKSHLRSKLRGNAIANVITGTLGYVFTGNLFGPISAIQTTTLMLRGESAVGSRYAEQVQRQLPMIEDEEVLTYVREIGNKLADVAGRDEFEYEFHVIMDDQLNAFALPGGKVFVNAGAIMKTKSEAELAGLLAHELAHAVLSHGFQLVTEGNLIANVTQYIPFGRTAANLIVLDYNRDMERQADALGTRILVSGGYAADGLYNLMETLDSEGGPRPLFAWLSTHPRTKERMDNIETLVERNAYNRYTYEGVERHLAIQERVAKLLAEYEERKECEEDKECAEKLERESEEVEEGEGDGEVEGVGGDGEVEEGEGDGEVEGVEGVMSNE